jgi:hypothetical protein
MTRFRNVVLSVVVPLAIMAIGLTITTIIAVKNFDPVLDAEYHAKGIDYQKYHQSYLNASKRRIGVKNLKFRGNILTFQIENVKEIAPEISGSLELRFPASSRVIEKINLKAENFRKCEHSSICGQVEIKVDTESLFEYEFDIYIDANTRVYYSEKV